MNRKSTPILEQVVPVHGIPAEAFSAALVPEKGRRYRRGPLGWWARFNAWCVREADRRILGDDLGF